ncbi:MAG: EAL domain-containing protein [Ilumatobacteraceae bacterium]
MGEGERRQTKGSWVRSYALAGRFAGLCVAFVAFMLVVAATTGTDGVNSWIRWTHLVLVGFGLLGLYVMWRWRRSEGRGWLPLGMSFAAYSVAQVLLAFRVDGDLARRTLSTSDVLLVVWGLGMVAYLGVRLMRADRRIGLVHLLDAGVITLAMTLALWEQVIAPAIGDLDRLPAVHQVVLVVMPAIDLYVASILLLGLFVDRSPARIAWFVAMLFLTAGDVLQSSVHDATTTQALAWIAPLWMLGVGGIIVAAALPAGARLIGGRPTLSRLIVVNAFLVMALWVATWHYVINSRPATVTSVVIGLVAGLVYGAEHVAAFRQSAHWADQLSEKMSEVERAHLESRALLDDLPEAVVVLDRHGRIRDVNVHAIELTGRDRDHLIGRMFGRLFREDERPLMVDLWEKMHAGDGRLLSPTFTIDRSDGADILLEADANVPVRDPDRVVIALRNVTERVAEAKRLDRARERFRLAFHNAPTGMALIAVADGTLIDVNDSLADMLRRTRYELVGAHVDDIAHPLERESTTALLAAAIDHRQEGYRAEQRFLRGDGATVWAKTWASVMNDEHDSLAIVHIEDITERLQNDERMRWAATHDDLTGLPNRASFLERLGGHLEHAEPGSIAVLFIDLDNFKVINDSLGHDAGDQLLRAMSDRLRTVVRDRDVLGRFGGDEFIVMLRDVGGNYDPFEVANRLRKEIAEPVLVDGAELFVTASIGITVFDRDGVTTTEMLRDADAAMYRAKARGRDCVEVFSPGSHDASVLSLRTTTELRRGLERGEIVPYYQPIVQLDNGHLIGFEVLARWRHPDRGLLTPEQFLPLAEESGLIGELGEKVLEMSLVQLGQWRDRTQRFSDLSLSVNLSARQLAVPDLVDKVANALAYGGVSAGALWLEITETALMTDERAAVVVLRQLRNLGLHLSVDDFGTGYSSLTYLKRFPVEAIKIDHQFVSGLGINDEDTTIVEAVVQLGHSLGLSVTAEGVETPLQLASLRGLGCDRGQGYLFGRPRPADLIESEYALT